MARGSEIRSCQQRYTLACASIPAEKGDLILRTGCGTLQGDPFAVASFVHGFRPSVDRWIARRRQEDKLEHMLTAE
eukprot:4841422-Pyramimonas_sp.AAC.1